MTTETEARELVRKFCTAIYPEQSKSFFDNVYTMSADPGTIIRRAVDAAVLHCEMQLSDIREYTTDSKLYHFRNGHYTTIINHLKSLICHNG